MGWRFFRRVKLAPGLRLNLSSRGASLTAGPRGSTVTFGKRGVHSNVSIPGTGLSYRRKLFGKRKGDPGKAAPKRTQKPKFGLIQRLTLSAEEKAFVRALEIFAQGNPTSAMPDLRLAATLADGAFLAGVVALSSAPAEAEGFLLRAQKARATLGQHFKKFDVVPELLLPVTTEISAALAPDERGVGIALAECYQLSGEPKRALQVLKKLNRIDPDDLFVRLSAAELFVEERRTPKALRSALKVSDGLKNESAVHAGLLYFRGKAQRLLGLNTAARQTLSLAMRRKKDRPTDLLHAIRYERALAYEQLGQKAKARSDLERVFAENSKYEDVSARLGL
jgi:tetratricopeptide (TPR) repeat protein